jgi:hypothetical protein
MSAAVFFRVLSCADKGAVLAQAVASLREGRQIDSVTYVVEPQTFRQMPGSAFAYWLPSRVRRLFNELQPFEGQGRDVKQGLATADDFRFVRCWWEVNPERIVTGSAQTVPEDFRRQTFEGKRWVPFAKGGAYSPYYAEPHLLVNWERDGEEIKTRINPTTQLPYSNVWQLGGTERDYFFRPGLTWPLRTNGFSVRVLPRGTVFGHKGPTAFVSGDDQSNLFALAALMNSRPFWYLTYALLGNVALAQSFEVGLIASLPIPEFSPDRQRALAQVGGSNAVLQRELDATEETSHAFVVPVALPLSSTVASQLRDRNTARLHNRQTFEASRRQADSLAMKLYGIIDEDASAVERILSEDLALGTSEESLVNDEEETEIVPDADSAADEENFEPTTDPCLAASSLLSYAIGCVFGRWDVRLAIDEPQVPKVLDLFSPLSPGSPGMLTDSDGLPAKETPPDYPIRIEWDGILPDDPGHAGDIVRRIREVFELILGDRAVTVEREVCELLEVRELRDCFRNPRVFFEFHWRSYSKSKRKAPIYWLLQSQNRSYALWLYYPRLSRDSVFKALQQYVEPKINAETARLTEMKNALASADDLQRRDRTRREKETEAQEDLLIELGKFRDALRRVADLGYDPDHDDGVPLNIAPFHELIPWKEPKAKWRELLQREYEWSTIAKRLHAKSVTRS